MMPGDMDIYIDIGSGVGRDIDVDMGMIRCARFPVLPPKTCYCKLAHCCIHQFPCLSELV